MGDAVDRDTEAYLARIRKTIADSAALLSQAELRIAETDRMLARQGLTREQVSAMRFSPDQIEAANAHLARLGLDPVDAAGLDAAPAAHETDAGLGAAGGGLPPVDSGADLAERRRKFGMMMQPFHI